MKKLLLLTLLTPSLYTMAPIKKAIAKVVVKVQTKPVFKATTAALFLNGIIQSDKGIKDAKKRK